MNIIQVITDEWIDIIYLDLNNAIRKINKDTGIYRFIDIEHLEIIWEKWGLEIFYKKGINYYNCKNDYFEIHLDTNEWNDIGIFNINENTITRKYFPSEYGTYEFKDNDLIIKINKL